MSKKNLRKAALATMATTAAAVAAVPAVSAESTSFSDVKPGSTHYDAIQALTEAGVIQGLGDGTFGAWKNITRNQVASIFQRALKLPVPANKAEVLKKAYSDITVKSENSDAIAAVTAAGIFGGNGGKFGQWTDISREQMASVVVRALDLAKYNTKEDVKVNLSNVSSVHRANVQILANLGVTKELNDFRPTEKVQRAAFSSFVYRAQETVKNADIEAPVLTVNGDKTVNVEFGGTVVLPEVTGKDNKDEKVEVKSVITDASGKTIDKIDTKVPGTYKVTYSATDAAGNKAEDVVVTVTVKEEVAPKVASVKAINATQVEVAFTQPVNKTDAETAGKVTVEGVNFNARSLSEDGKTLTLTASAPINVTNAAVVVDAIQTKADANAKTEKYVSLLTYKDEVAPTIASVEAKSNGTTATELTVKASEPIQSAVAKVNGDYVSVNFGGTDTAKITGLSLETGKTHTIELINLEDKAGNKTVSTSATFAVSVDNVAPVATLSQKEDNQILVTFNKKMDVNSVTTALANGAVKDEALVSVNTGTVTEVTESNGTQFIIPVNDALYTNDRTSRTLNVVLSDVVKDTLGNKLTATTQKVTLAKDTSKPVATGYTVVKDNDGKVKAVELNFSKGLKAGTVNAGTALSNAAVTNSIVNENGVLEGATFDNFVSKTVSAGDTKVVFEATTAQAINGKYAFSFIKELVSDQAQTVNKSGAFSYTIDFGQSKQDTEFVLRDQDINASTPNVIKVTFPEAVKGGAVAGSATDRSNYTLAGKPLPEGTTITLNAGPSPAAQTVATITLPAESVSKDDANAVFTATNVKNTAGTKTLKSYTGTVDVKDNVSPVLESAKVLDNKTIELTYSEAIASLGTDANVFDDFEIKNGSTTALSLTTGELKANNVSGFDKKIRLTLDKGAVTAGTAEVNTLTVTGPATATGDINVTFNDGGTPVTKTVSVNNAETASTVAGKIATAFSTLSGYTVTTSGDTVVFTADSARADKNVSVTVADDSATTGIGGSIAETTAGVAPTVKDTFDLTKDITVETKASTDLTKVTDNSTAKNEQKAAVKVTVSK